MSRELLQLALDVLDEATTYTSSPSWSPSMTGECKDVADALRARIAQEDAQPVAWRDLTDEDRNRAFDSMPDLLDGFLKTWGWLHFSKAIELECKRKNATPQAQPAPAVPADMVMVPLSFVQGFNTLAHNWSLRAEPPSFYTGTEGDAFTRAYAECGQALAKLRAMIAAAPAPLTDTRKLCTCDGAGRGPGRACVVHAGGRLGDLWKCAKSAAPAVPAVDCRTCARCYATKGHGVFGCDSVVACTNGDRYQPLPPVRLWRAA